MPAEQTTTATHHQSTRHHGVPSDPSLPITLFPSKHQSILSQYKRSTNTHLQEQAYSSQPPTKNGHPPLNLPNQHPNRHFYAIDSSFLGSDLPHWYPPRSSLWQHPLHCNLRNLGYFTIATATGSSALAQGICWYAVGSDVYCLCNV